MHISKAIFNELILDPLFAQELVLIEQLLESSSCIAIIYGRTDIIEEEFDGVHSLYYPSTVPFTAIKTKSGIEVEYD